MMAQLLQVLERNWLSPKSREECSAEPCVPSHVSRVSAAGPGTGSSSSLLRRLLGKLGLVWVSQKNKSWCFLVLSNLQVVSVVAFSYTCLCGLLKDASFYSHGRKLPLEKTGSPRNFFCGEWWHLGSGFGDLWHLGSASSQQHVVPELRSLSRSWKHGRLRAVNPSRVTGHVITWNNSNTFCFQTLFLLTACPRGDSRSLQG